MLAAVSTAWADTDYGFQATFSNVSSPVYNGQEQTVSFTVDNANCSYDISNNKGTNAGTYNAQINPQCTGHTNTDDEGGTHIFVHKGTITVAWTIQPRNLVDGVTITVKDQKWTGNDIQIAAGDDALYTIKYNDTDLELNKDYQVTVTKLNTPTTVKDEGRYVIVFKGIGNFTGIVTKTFDVKKDLSQGEDITGVHYDIPEQIYLNGQISFDFQVEVTDRFSHTKLYEGEDYTMKFFKAEAADAADEVEETAIKPYSIDNGDNESVRGQKYWVEFTGVAPKYDPETKIKKAFYVVKEYQECDPTQIPNVYPNLAKVNMRLTKGGYPIALDSPEGAIVKGQAQVAPKPGTGGPAIDIQSTRCLIQDTVKVAITTGDATEFLNHDVVGVQDMSFAACFQLRWIDSWIPGDVWTPKSLSRSVPNTPFYGIPKQTLVYLNGVNIKGENYIYKITKEDFRSELFHIYEDVKGDQTKYSDSANE